MARNLPFVGVTVSPQVKPNTEWYLHSIVKSDAITPVTTAPTSLATPIANRSYSFSTKRGRTYDLGRLETGECSVVVNNSDSIFDPTNTASPLYPNVAPYRPLRITCAYPLTGNILNDTNIGIINKYIANLTSAVGNGTQTIFYSNSYDFKINDVVSVTGMGAGNVIDKTITATYADSFAVANSWSGTVTANGAASKTIPVNYVDKAVSVCANDSNFDLSYISNWYGFGSTPVTTTAAARSGTYSMLMGISSQYFLDVPCVAGQKITFSFWARSQTGTSAGTFGIYAGGYINSGQSRTVTSNFSTTTTFARYSVTTTATSPKVTVIILSTGSINNFIDDVQVEFGDNATSNTTTGSTIYNLFNGFIERYPQTYQAPNRGQSEIMATDIVGMMSQNVMLNPYTSLVIQDPTLEYYFPFTEPKIEPLTVTAATYSSGKITYTCFNNFIVGDWVTVLNSTNTGFNNLGLVTSATASTFTLSATAPTGSFTGSANAFKSYAYNTANTTHDPMYFIINGSPNVLTFGDETSKSLVGFNDETGAKFDTSGAGAFCTSVVEFDAAAKANVLSSSFMVDVWVRLTAAGHVMAIYTDKGILDVSVNAVNAMVVEYNPTVGSTQSFTVGTAKLPFNEWRLIRISRNGTTVTGRIVGFTNTANTMTVSNTNFGTTINRVTLTSATSSISYFKGLRIAPYSTVNLGSNLPQDLFLLGYFGNLALPDGESTDVDSTGQRFSKIMSTYSGFGYVPTASDLGNNSMQGAITSGRTVFDVVQTAADSEVGDWYVSGDGFVVFNNQSNRVKQQRSLATFGDGAGEYPINGSELVFNYDLTYTYNQISLERLNGSTFYAEDIDSIDKYFPRTLTFNLENASDVEVNDLPALFLAQYKEPKIRPDQIVLLPSSNPDLWPIALGSEIGDTITVKHRPIGGNAISVNAIIQNIEHNFDAQSSVWETRFSLSPVVATS